MRERTSEILPARLEEGRRQFEQWRRNRKKCRTSPTPESLWAMAVGLAREYGLYKTARVLNLDYTRLKQRLEAGVPDPPRKPPAQRGFAELAPLSLATPAQCVVELEEPRGAKMRIQLRGAGTVDLSALTRAFLQGAS